MIPPKPAPGTVPRVDARGARCPLPVIELARRIASLPVGSEVVLLATDPAAASDVPAFCRMRRHRLLSVSSAPDHTEFRVLIGPTAPAAEPATPT